MEANNQPGYTWKTFKEEVLKRCPFDKNRIGVGDFLDSQIRDAVIDLQGFIPAFTRRHESIYYPDDFAVDGAASVGALPPSSKLLDCWMFNVDDAQRFECVAWPWEKRFEMVNREVPNLLDNDYVLSTTASLAAIETVNRLLRFMGPRKHAALFCVDPEANTFYLYPQLSQGWVLSMFWKGKKLDFQDDEYVPFCEKTAMAVSLWVRANMRREVERDTEGHKSYMRDYTIARTNLYLDNKEAGELT